MEENSHADKLFSQLHRCLNAIHSLACRNTPHKPGQGHHRGQGLILAILHEQDGISQRELAERLQVRPPSLSELLDKLESSGMIERRQNDTDRRMSFVFLTGEGRLAAANMAVVRQEKRRLLDAGLNRDEQAALSQLLEKLLESLASSGGQAACCSGAMRHRQCQADNETGLPDNAATAHACCCGRHGHGRGHGCSCKKHQHS